MKLCKLNIEKDNSRFHPFETDQHFDDRRHVLVGDDYDFNDQEDEDVSNDPLAWKDHYKRLQINFVHAYNIIKGLVFTLANSDPLNPTFDLVGSLSDTQNALGVEYHVYPYSLRVGGTYVWQVDEETDKVNWQNILLNTKEGRIEIVELMRKAVGQYIRTGQLSLSQTQEFYRDLYPLTEFYIQCNDPEMKVWLNSEDDTANSGYNHSTTGLDTQSYHIADMKTDILDIYNGIHYETYQPE